MSYGDDGGGPRWWFFIDRVRNGNRENGQGPGWSFTPINNWEVQGHLEFCIEIMRLKPSFGWKLNEHGFSPIQLALQNNKHNVVRRLVEINKDLVRVKGREGITPLHFVCQSGDSEDNITLLIYLLKSCPNCIEDVNVRNETALHIALLSGNLIAFRELAVDLLMRTVVDINARNLKNETALDLAEAHPSLMIKRTFFNYLEAAPVDLVYAGHSLRDRRKAKLSSLDRLLNHFGRLRSQLNEENRNAYLVVATLVVTAIYQAVLSPPDGLTQDQGGSDNNNNAPNTTNTNNLLNSTTAAGRSVMPPKLFSYISVLNAYIFLIGITTIVWLMPNSARLFFLLTILSVVIFVASYAVSELAIAPYDTRIDRIH
ncbi:hypothetical protein PIB30_067996 [Stylosanthes scabra]|uniref:PGG domain-containing protein n=1 Tax=Stylosanthes scabra TaxID=79078 RepID=A0ABU6SMW5_9FABA|nr:hypothetical protein [Stylosanthes scabra]